MIPCHVPTQLHNWQDLLCDFESIGSSGPDIGLFVRGTPCMLVDNLCSSDDNPDIVHADLLTPRGTSAKAAIDSYLTWDKEGKTGKVKLLWKNLSNQVKKATKVWLLHVQEPHDFHGNFDYEVNANTVIIPIGGDSNTTQQLKVLEMFAGYYGGWHRGCAFLQENFDVSFRNVAIESDLRACAFYASSRGIPIFDAYKPLPVTLLEQFSGDCVFHGDVTAMNWVPIISSWQPDMLCISAPCQPWSAAASGPGLADSQGMTFVESLLVGRWVQPAVILLENVIGVMKHQHFQALLRTMGHVGYKILWSGAVELKAICPVQRPRWLAILVNPEANLPDVTIQHLTDWFGTPSPLTFQSVLTNKILVDAVKLGISDAVKRTLSDPQYSPHPKKKKMSKTEIFEARCYSGWQTLPCFLAAYGSQHRMVEGVEGKVCLAHLAKVGDGPVRHWHPCEVLLHHLLLGDVLLPQDLHEAWKGVGNQISTPHAIFLLHNALSILRSDTWKHSLKDVMKQALDTRVKADNLIFQVTNVGTLISTREKASHFNALQIEAIRQLVEEHGSSFMPDGKWWDLNGFHELHELMNIGMPSEVHASMSHVSPLHTEIDEIEEFEPSPTAPMPVYVPFSILMSTGNKQAWAASDVSPQDLCSLWGKKFQLASHDAEGVLPTNAMVIQPASIDSSSGNCKDVLACWIDNNLLVLPKDELTLTHDRLNSHFPGKQLYDAFGAIKMGQDFHGSGCQDFLIRQTSYCIRTFANHSCGFREVCSYLWVGYFFMCMGGDAERRRKGSGNTGCAVHSSDL